MYICMYTCVCVHIHAYCHAYVRIHLHVDAHTHTPTTTIPSAEAYPVEFGREITKQHYNALLSRDYLPKDSCLLSCVLDEDDWMDAQLSEVEELLKSLA